MKKMICFDMDGTIADLYGVSNWKEQLRKENPTPYIEARPIFAPARLNLVIERLMAQGWEIRIITWLSKDSSSQYKKAVTQAKKEWLRKYHFPYHKAHFVQYGTTKADCIRKVKPDFALLIDDSEKVRNGWHLGATLDPTYTDMIKILEDLAGC